MARPTFPNTSHHVAIAGRTGSGKTWGALDMLSRRLSIPWIVIDHKKDDSIAKLPKERLAIGPMFLPTKPGLYHVTPSMRGSDRDGLEQLLEKAFKRGNIGIYVDEGHLMGPSDAVRDILVAGRSKHVPLMWVSQRAHHIDTFIWSQATYYRAYSLQTAGDIKRFNENFPERYTPPPLFHSFYYDGNQMQQYLLGPSGSLEETIKRIDGVTLKQYGAL